MVRVDLPIAPSVVIVVGAGVDGVVTVLAANAVVSIFLTEEEEQ